MGMPFLGIANPKVFLASKPFGKEPDLYENENVEVIYLLRFNECNFCASLFGKKTNDLPLRKRILARLLPHTILKGVQDSAVIVRATDFINSWHHYLVSSKQRMKTMHFGLF